MHSLDELKQKTREFKIAKVVSDSRGLLLPLFAIVAYFTLIQPDPIGVVYLLFVFSLIVGFLAFLEFKVVDYFKESNIRTGEQILIITKDFGNGLDVLWSTPVIMYILTNQRLVMQSHGSIITTPLTTNRSQVHWEISDIKKVELVSNQIGNLGKTLFGGWINVNIYVDPDSPSAKNAGFLRDYSMKAGSFVSNYNAGIILPESQADEFVQTLQALIEKNDTIKQNTTDIGEPKS